MSRAVFHCAPGCIPRTCARGETSLRAVPGRSAAEPCPFGCGKPSQCAGGRQSAEGQERGRGPSARRRPRIGSPRSSCLRFTVGLRPTPTHAPAGFVVRSGRAPSGPRWRADLWRCGHTWGHRTYLCSDCRRVRSMARMPGRLLAPTSRDDDNSERRQIPRRFIRNGACPLSRVYFKRPSIALTSIQWAPKSLSCSRAVCQSSRQGAEKRTICL